MKRYGVSSIIILIFQIVTANLALSTTLIINSPEGVVHSVPRRPGSSGPAP